MLKGKNLIDLVVSGLLFSVIWFVVWNVVSFVYFIGGLIGGVNWEAFGVVSIAIFGFLMLITMVYNLYQRSVVIRKHRSILRDIDEDFELKKEAYAEFLEDEESGLVSEDDMDDLRREYDERTVLTQYEGDKR